MKWKRSKYRIFGSGGAKWREGWLHESGLFAVESRYGVCITHVPTGFLIPSHANTVGQAKAICEYLASQPRIWSAGYQFGKWPAHSNRQKSRRIKRLKEAEKECAPPGVV